MFEKWYEQMCAAKDAWLDEQDSDGWFAIWQTYFYATQLLAEESST